MKFQNIKNPEIIADLLNDWYLSDDGYNIILKMYSGRTYKYSTLAEFYREWKDYTTLLPESIRESFKQWAKYNGINRVVYHSNNNNHSWFSEKGNSTFTYDIKSLNKCYEDSRDYSVEELVGE